MSKVTSKLQVTLPKAIAERFGIRPGDDIDWEPAGDVIRVILGPRKSKGRCVEERLAIFDRASVRQAARQKGRGAEPDAVRGWSREELYLRDRPD